jgi:DNA uptake protein ComE-like DNA-binding protein
MHGPFRSLEGLQRVRGIGPALARQLQGYVTFGGTGRP